MQYSPTAHALSRRVFHIYFLRLCCFNSGEIGSRFPGIFDFKMEILMFDSKWSNLTWLFFGLLMKVRFDNRFGLQQLNKGQYDTDMIVNV